MSGEKQVVEQVKKVLKSDLDEDEVAVRGQRLLQYHGRKICSGLLQLKRRSEAGHILANQIRDTLIEGITEYLPSRLFIEHAKYFFWGLNEPLSDVETAVRDILDEALLKKTDKDEEEALKRLEALKCVDRGAGSSSEVMSKKEGEVAILLLLINVLKVTHKTVEEGRWTWDTDDKELLKELRDFQVTLIDALGMFEELYKTTSFEDLMKIIFRFSVEGCCHLPPAQEEKELMASVSCETSSAAGYSSEAGSYEAKFSEEESDFDDNEDEDEDEDKGAAKAEPRPSCSHVQDAKKKVVKQFVVRRFIDAEGKRKRRPMAFKCTICEHVDCSLPPAHGHDCKKLEGLWCYCGKKFATKKELDRHLTYNSESMVLSCPQCDYKVNRRCCMENHKKDMHDKLQQAKASKRLYKCVQGCGQVFQSKLKMRKHISETNRECLHKNAGRPPTMFLPEDPMAFISMLKSTLARSGVELTAEKLDAALKAASKDSKRLLHKNKQEWKDFQQRHGVPMDEEEEQKSIDNLDKSEENDADEDELQVPKW